MAVFSLIKFNAFHSQLRQHCQAFDVGKSKSDQRDHCWSVSVDINPGGRLALQRFSVVYLDSAQRLIASEEVARGTVDECAAYPREIMARALELRAKGLVLAHNHPSDRAEPSKADIRLTRIVSEACRLFGIALHDHVILTRNGHVNMKLQGLI